MPTFTFPEHHIIDILIYRGSAADVDTVMVNGEILVKEGKLVLDSPGR